MRATKDAFKTVQSEVEKIQDSETFRSYLDMLSRFHEYSPNNIMLIMAQKPDATRVASYDTWKHLGRQVRRDESGLNVFVPRFPPGTTKEQQEQLTPSGYGIGRVFDVPLAQLQKTKTMAHELSHHFAKHGTKEAEEMAQAEQESAAPPRTTGGS
jgi:hypothetical protein